MLRQILFLSYFFVGYGSLFSMESHSIENYGTFSNKIETHHSLCVCNKKKKLKNNNSGSITASFFLISTITEELTRNTTKSDNLLIGEESIISKDIGRAIKGQLLDVTAHERYLWEMSKVHHHTFSAMVPLSTFEFMNLNKKSKAIAYGIKYCSQMRIEISDFIFDTRESYDYFLQLPLFVRKKIISVNKLYSRAWVKETEESNFTHADKRLFAGFLSGVVFSGPIINAIVQNDELCADKYMLLSTAIMCALVGSTLSHIYNKVYPETLDEKRIQYGCLQRSLLAISKSL